MMKIQLLKREREVTDRGAIIKILDKCQVLNLGLCDEDQPYVVPLNYGYVMEDDHLVLYLHGAKEGYKYEVMKKNPKVSFSMVCDAQLFEGKVACQYGMTYSSIMGKGTIKIIDDVDEKIKALTILMKIQTGKDFTFNERLVSIVNVMRLDVTDFTAKHRPLPPVLDGKCEGEKHVK